MARNCFNCGKHLKHGDRSFPLRLDSLVSYVLENREREHSEAGRDIKQTEISEDSRVCRACRAKFERKIVQDRASAESISAEPVAGPSNVRLLAPSRFKRRSRAGVI